MFHQVSESWRAFLLLSLFLQLASWMLVIYWSRCHWHNHPISRALQAHIQPPNSGWGSVAASVNNEFRQIDKFATGLPGARIIVTENWVLKVSKKSSKLQSAGHVQPNTLIYTALVLKKIRLLFKMTLGVTITICIECLSDAISEVSLLWEKLC